MTLLVLVLLAQSDDFPAGREHGSTAAGKYTQAVELIKGREYGQATALLNELAVTQPRWAEVFAARCSAQLGLGRPEYAAADCRYALTVKPALAVALYSLATAESRMGQTTEAAAHFRQYVMLDTPDATPELKALAQQQADALQPVEPELPPPPPPSQTTHNWTVVVNGPPAGPAARRGLVRETGCKSHLDCGSGAWCKNRGDGVKVCMDNGGHGDYCSSSLDCGRGFCKDRGDGVRVCMDRGEQDGACESSIDCGRGFCKDRGDGYKVCMDRGSDGSYCSSAIDCGPGLWCRSVGGVNRCME